MSKYLVNLTKKNGAAETYSVTTVFVPYEDRYAIDLPADGGTYRYYLPADNVSSIQYILGIWREQCSPDAICSSVQQVNEIPFGILPLDSNDSDYNDDDNANDDDNNNFAIYSTRDEE